MVEGEGYKESQTSMILTSPNWLRELEIMHYRFELMEAIDVFSCAGYVTTLGGQHPHLFALEIGDLDYAGFVIPLEVIRIEEHWVNLICS